MSRYIVCGIAIAFALTAAAPPVNFSGVWKMDASRSESAHQDVPVGAVTLVITQSPSNVTIETRTDERDRATIANETLTFKADGSETVAAGEGGTPLKSKMHWDGPKLITETTRSVKDATVSTRNVFTMNPGGGELTLEKSLTIQHGYMGLAANSTGKGKDVFVKDSAALRK